MPLAGGIEQMGFQCGQVWGAALAAGARAFQLFGPGSQAEAAAVIAAQRLVASFLTSYKSINCLEVIDSPEATDAIDRFLGNSDGEFECATIVGRKFENVNDHAAYLRDGGCSKMIEALAAQPV